MYRLKVTLNSLSISTNVCVCGNVVCVNIFYLFCVIMKLMPRYIFTSTNIYM